MSGNRILWGQIILVLAAVLAMTWTLPPEPHDAEEAGQQLSDYFDAVAAMVCRLEGLHSGH